MCRNMQPLLPCDAAADFEYAGNVDADAFFLPPPPLPPAALA